MRTVGEIHKNAIEKIVASLRQRKGGSRIDLRVYYRPEVHKPGGWVPTKKGINFDSRSWKDFKALIRKVDKAVRSRG